MNDNPVRNAMKKLRTRRNGAFVSVRGVEICDDSTVDAGCRIFPRASITRSSIGAFSMVGRNSNILDASIGRYCSISWNVTVGAGQHPIDHLTSHAFPFDPSYRFVRNGSAKEQPRVSIGSDVWIGCQAVVMPGLHVGDGAVVGAGAVVTHNVGDYEIVAGVPARILGHRWDREIRERIAALEWWNWPPTLIRRHTALFRQPVDAELLGRLEAVALRLGGAKRTVGGGTHVALVERARAAR